jgi:type IV secretory pathway TraG/TraD family ATPase VirD4
MESIIGALNALILNRLVTRVNTGQGKNIPVSIIVDELPTLYFHKIDRLIGTARSNKVSVALGFQELPQLGIRLWQGGYAEGYHHCWQCRERLCKSKGNLGMA